MAFEHYYGVDLGSGTVKIYDHKTDAITKEQNMIAIRKKESVIAVGNDAYEIFEKAPADIEVITPMQNGRIGDVGLVEAVLHTLLAKNRTFVGYKPTLFFSVPSDMTEIEKRAYYTIAHRGMLRRGRVFLVEKPIADALAIGIPIQRTKGSMIINIGSQGTEMSVIANKRVIISKIIPVGGKTFNRAIASAVRRKNSFQISLKAAKDLKIRLTDLDGNRPDSAKVMGIDSVTGLPRDGLITSYTVTTAIREQLQEILAEARTFLERTPPQIHSSIVDEGIYLTGGSTQIPGIDRFFMNALNCSVQVSQYYDLSTIFGLRELIGHPVLHRLAFAPRNRKL